MALLRRERTGKGRLVEGPICAVLLLLTGRTAAALPDLSREAVLGISRKAYRHLGRTTIESALLPSVGREKVLDLVESLEGWEILEEAVSRGRGVILVTGHLGNWELGGAYIAARGVPLDELFAYATDSRKRARWWPGAKVETPSRRTLAVSRYLSAKL